MGCHTSTTLSAGKGSGAVLCQDCGTVLQKNKPGSLGESSTASKKIVGDLDNITCKDKLQQWGKAEWEFKYLSMLKVPAKKQK